MADRRTDAVPSCRRTPCREHQLFLDTMRVILTISSQARLSDMYGRKWVAIIPQTIGIIGTTVCATAHESVLCRFPVLNFKATDTDPSSQ